MYTGADQFKIHDLTVAQQTVFDRQGTTHQITRVRMWVGDHGPFQQDFGPGTLYTDDSPSIDSWKMQTVDKVRQAVTG